MATWEVIKSRKVEYIPVAQNHKGMKPKEICTHGKTILVTQGIFAIIALGDFMQR
jgi:hypothetical protein